MVKSIYTYLHQRFVGKLTLQIISEEFNMPISTLKRCFKGVFGQTVHQCIKECRMAEAKRLLTDTDTPILQITNAVGYGNGSKFTVAFKDVIGIKPSDYRKQM